MFPVRKIFDIVSRSQRWRCIARRSTLAKSINVEDQWNQKTVAVPKNVSLSEYIFQEADEFSGKTAITDDITGYKVGYDQLREEIRTLSSSLHHLRVRHRDAVTFCGTNTPYLMHVLCGVTDNGAALSLASPLLTADELASQLRQTRSRYVIATPDCAATAIQACFLSPYTEEVIAIGDVPGCRPLSSLLEKKELPSHPRVHINPDSTPAVIPFSSGTTGLPKGVVLTHTNLIANLCQLRHPRFLSKTSDDETYLTTIPTVHMAGLTIGMCLPLSQGIPVVTQPRFVLQDFLRAVQDHQATFALMSPPVVNLLAKSPMVDSYNLSSLETPFSGASSLTASLTEMFVDRLNLPGIRQGYGLTETSPATHICPRDHWKYGSVGLPLPSTRCKVLDPDTRDRMGPGDRGVLHVTGPQVMRGYVNNPESTQRAFSLDGWLKTGDIGYYDEDGHYFIVDRLKDIIKYKGYQISPAYLESVLLRHGAVEEVAVVGVPADVAGEVPRAFVVTSQHVAEKQLVEFVADNVAPYMRLRGGVEFVEDIPKIPSGKILRRFLRDNYVSKQGETVFTS